MTSGMGQRIQIMRKLNNISTEELSERVGLSASYIDLIECGDRSPSLETLITICTELNASLDFVVNGYGAKAQIKISPAVFCTGDEDENDFGFSAEWDEITKKVNLEQSVSELIISYGFTEMECLVLLDSIKHFAEQINRIKQMNKLNDC